MKLWRCRDLAAIGGRGAILYAQTMNDNPASVAAARA